MATATRKIAIFLICINLAINALVVTGWAAAAGYQPAIGGDDAVEDAQTVGDQIEAEDTDAAGGLLSIIRTSIDAFWLLFGVIFAFPAMLINIGAPLWSVSLLTGPLYVIAGADLIGAFSDRRV